MQSTLQKKYRRQAENPPRQRLHLACFTAAQRQAQKKTPQGEKRKTTSRLLRDSATTGATANDVIPPLTPFPVGGMIVR